MSASGVITRDNCCDLAAKFCLLPLSFYRIKCTTYTRTVTIVFLLYKMHDLHTNCYQSDMLFETNARFILSRVILPRGSACYLPKERRGITSPEPPIPTLLKYRQTVWFEVDRYSYHL
ncbi:hypothetical protein V1264_008253 [Littorina saxatilis]|uniref:Uncharacterized protein n=1 Tax=Littorina saxatilis TaxID=31220 RepID=A0AAN9ASP5_9CAEN